MKDRIQASIGSLRRMALLGTAALLVVASLGIGTPVLAATQSPTPTPTSNKPAPPKGTPAPSAPALPANAPKPGVKPVVPPSRIARQALAPATAASASLPATTCTAGTCDLWALTGTIQVAGGPGGGLPVWGFSSSAGGPAQIPGPNLIVSENDNITVTLHHQLQVTRPDGRPERLSLEMPAVQVQPDTSGITSGQTRSYHFGKLKPGTYLYQAGPTADAPRQVRMGLAGLLIVRPANFSTTNSAYGTTANDGFTAEATAALNEFDPEFNADPFKADPIDYHASLFLLNGRTFDPANPTLGKIDVGPGDILLLRYADLGPHDRGLTLENERQRVLADDSHLLRNPADVATKWLTAGQVSDALVTVDPQEPLNSHIPIFESGFHFNNGPSLGLGGALSYLDVVKGVGGAPGGPLTQVTVTPPTNAGRVTDAPEHVTGAITATTGALNSAAEWFLDDVTAPGTGQPITLGAGGSVDFTISQIQLNTMLMSSANRDGDHVVWVHGQDAGGWGVVSGDVFTYNASGADAGALSVHVSPTNGSRFTDVANGAGPNGADKPTADLMLLGSFAAALPDWVVIGGEYCLDGTNCATGSGTPVYVTPVPNPAPAFYNSLPDGCVPPPPPPGITPPTPGDPPGGGSTVSFCGVVPASVLNAKPEGVHTLYFRACEVPNQASSTFPGSCRWGDFGLAGASISFLIDKHGPAAGHMVLDPNPNNGTLNAAGNLNFLDSVQAAATLDDSSTGNSNISYGEVFLTSTSVTADPVPASQFGTGAEMIPANARWDSPNKQAYAYVPLAELTSYPEGLVRFWAHGRDLAGNWGGWAYTDLTLDRTAPKFDSPPTPADGSQIGPCTAGCSVTVGATDPLSSGVHSKIVQAEWFVDQGAHLICEQPPGPGCTPEVVAPGDPGKGNGTAIPIASPGYTVTVTFNTGPQPAGTKVVFRVRDAAGNWSINSMVVTR
ncbi:MAG: multicopper oxidase domain-containing protein [Candidatus Dormibacteraeota bacterium]|nr:multicopper oxidase domain-containing protein [Candidatus Dormibacteraeota bacterium]